MDRDPRENADWVFAGELQLDESVEDVRARAAAAIPLHGTEQIV
jgi:hypothetical protein